VDAVNGAQANATALSVVLCNCWADEWKAGLDSDGCEGELSCRNDDVADKLKKERDFLVVDTVPVDQYGTAVCENSAGWKDNKGTTNNAKALDWFDEQAKAATTHWAAKKVSLQKLIDAHTKAQEDRDDVRDGTGTNGKKGCTALSKIKSDTELRCAEQKSDTEAAYCKFSATKVAGCTAYDTCRSDASTAWTKIIAKERQNSQDRQDAWLATDMVKCITLAFSNNSVGGKITINATKTEECSQLTCNTASCTALDLTAKLDQVPPVKLPCITPPTTPPCSCDPTKWTSVTPLYFVGARTVPTCTVAATVVSPANVAAKNCKICT